MALFDLHAPFLVAYLLTLTVLFGLVMGSFLNCLAYRMAHGGSLLHGRSACPNCGHSLTARDLVPLASWLIQKRRCRYCQAAISARYPAVEFFTALCFLALVLRFGLTLQSLQLMIFIAILLILALVDFDTGYLPDALLVAGSLNFLMFVPFSAEPLSVLLDALIGGLALSVPLLLLTLVMDRVLKRASMGGGDIKLFFMIGLYLGWQNGLFCLILACLLGILFPFVCKQRTKEGQGAFPFGPAIALAAVLSLFLAEPVVAWYVRLF